SVAVSIGTRPMLAGIPLFLGDGWAYRRGRLRDRWDKWKVEYLAVENREGAYGELLANIRRLTVMVLDDLEEGSRLRTLDQGQKRLLSATGSRLLRLWRLALRDGGSRRVMEEARRIDGMVSETDERRRKGVEGWAW